MFATIIELSYNVIEDREYIDLMWSAQNLQISMRIEDHHQQHQSGLAEKVVN